MGTQKNSTIKLKPIKEGSASGKPPKADAHLNLKLLKVNEENQANESLLGRSLLQAEPFSAKRESYLGIDISPDDTKMTGTVLKERLQRAPLPPAPPPTAPLAMMDTNS